jgi:hypothetical protein
MKFKIFTLSIFTMLLSISNFAQGPVTEICLVTVDTTSSYNIIAWERSAQSSTLAIDSMQIYRRLIGGADTLLATVEYDSLSEYHDMSANPNLRGYTYRIAGKDIAGTVGPLSAPARTIHFIVVENASNELWLKWTPYIGKPIDYYQCWDRQGGGYDSLVNATSNNIDTAWNFTGIAPQSSYEMKVDVSWTSGCTTTKANHNTTRSNKAQGIFSGTDAFVEEKGVQELRVFPNPTEGIVNLSFSSLVWTPTTISVYDITGKKVKEIGTVKVLGNYITELDMTDLDAGLYNVIVNNGTPSVVKVLKK